MVEEIAPVVAGAAEAVIEAAEAAAEAHPVLEPVAEVVEEVGYLKSQILESFKKNFLILFETLQIIYHYNIIIEPSSLLP